MDRPKLEVADVFRRYGVAYREKHGASMSTGQRRVMTAIEVATTARYLRIATSKVCSTASPLDLLPHPVCPEPKPTTPQHF